MAPSNKGPAPIDDGGEKKKKTNDNLVGNVFQNATIAGAASNFAVDAKEDATDNDQVIVNHQRPTELCQRHQDVCLSL
ncbi:Uu.00g111830.m01.CDS01 [Anthostomella pinea]|uniref:Uu.00g111830.m01.CDS01 n=1 Tax=Anthostomella pinea TaxID=933095 RepID=A0AAI8VG49_9PEZI|nr:Uu.00g111830.m01.CDS01 [Anthostomella pinea]